jgi:hypothetical protein
MSLTAFQEDRLDIIIIVFSQIGEIGSLAKSFNNNTFVAINLKRFNF